MAHTKRGLSCSESSKGTGHSPLRGLGPVQNDPVYVARRAPHAGPPDADDFGIFIIYWTQIGRGRTGACKSWRRSRFPRSGLPSRACASVPKIDGIPRIHASKMGFGRSYCGRARALESAEPVECQTLVLDFIL